MSSAPPKATTADDKTQGVRRVKKREIEEVPTVQGDSPNNTLWLRAPTVEHQPAPLNTTDASPMTHVPCTKAQATPNGGIGGVRNTGEEDMKEVQTRLTSLKEDIQPARAPTVVPLEDCYPTANKGV